MKARPVPQFVAEMRAHATASQALTPGAQPWEPSTAATVQELASVDFALHAPLPPPISERLQFDGGIAVQANAAIPVARGLENAPLLPSQAERIPAPNEIIPNDGCAPALDVADAEPSLSSLATLRPLGQIRNSFILAVNEDGLWIIDQHVAHERVLFERLLKQRATQKIEVSGC